MGRCSLGGQHHDLRWEMEAPGFALRQRDSDLWSVPVGQSRLPFRPQPSPRPMAQGRDSTVPPMMVETSVRVADVAEDARLAASYFGLRRSSVLGGGGSAVVVWGGDLGPPTPRPGLAVL